MATENQEMCFAWIPEAPAHPGLCANLADHNPGKISDEIAVSTWGIHSARRFATREACQAWCDENPHPVFVPTEHGFFGPDSEAQR